MALQQYSVSVRKNIPNGFCYPIPPTIIAYCRRFDSFWDIQWINICVDVFSKFNLINFLFLLLFFISFRHIRLALLLMLLIFIALISFKFNSLILWNDCSEYILSTTHGSHCILLSHSQRGDYRTKFKKYVWVYIRLNKHTHKKLN